MTPEPSTAPASIRPRVLAVDDDRIMRTVISRVLTEADIDVVAVEVEEAVLLLANSFFDLVLCDRTMPGISGQELLDRVRSDPRFDFTPFLFLTASDEIDALVEGFGAGADDYITKPFHPSELLARVTAHLERAELRRRRQNELMDVATFAFEVERELTRASRGGPSGVLAVIDIPSLAAVGATLGERERRRVLEAIAGKMSESAAPLDILGATEHGDLAVLMPEANVRDAADRLRSMASKAASMVTDADGRKIRPVPMVGFASFESRRVETRTQLFERAGQAAAEAESTQDLQPRRWLPADPGGEGEKNDHKPGREMVQLGSTFTLGILVPFILYTLLDRIGLDISWPVYIAVVIGLVSTAALIWLEGVFAARHPGAPREAGAPEPAASAIICAYLPNEAATIIETVEQFLLVDYPAGLQIILAYNTPGYLPVEGELKRLADEHPNLLVLKVENSNSKAQNLNAALARATGDFVGVFDADHHPDPDSFHRAWRWLSNGYDVVQGHCLVRNPEETFLARMVAVEFETIYAVAHPGRWLRDGFGIFGGSNGYWRTEALHMTRMRGSMLTEDIDASMRVLQAGGRIASDPGLISRELATTTVRQIWNQRLRWSQGWTQVSLRHLLRMLRLPHFDLRQRFGVFMLLFQREIYPWLSIQMFPLVAFWWVRGDLLDWSVPVFVAATIFTSSVGPGMTLMAYKLSHPTIKRKAWFLQYGIFSTLIYTEAKNVIARVAHLKEALGESSWRVTPRSADPARATLPEEVGTTVFDHRHEGHGAPGDERAATDRDDAAIPAERTRPHPVPDPDDEDRAVAAGETVAAATATEIGDGELAVARFDTAAAPATDAPPPADESAPVVGSALVATPPGAELPEPSTDQARTAAPRWATPLVPTTPSRRPHRAAPRPTPVTGLCLWCGERRTLTVDLCARCGHGWIDEPLAASSSADAAARSDRGTRPRSRTWVGIGVAAVVAAAVAVPSLGLGNERPRSPSTSAGSAPAAPPLIAAAATTTTTVPSPATTAPPSTTDASATTLAPSTTTTTTALPPLPATEAVPEEALTLGAFGLGPFDFGSDGAAVAGSLVATLGQPDARSPAGEEWGMCPGETGRVLQWEGLSAIFRDEADGEVFVGYRYDGATGAWRTISGMEPGMTIDEARAVYRSSIIATSTLGDGEPIFLLLRSSDRRTLLWGPIEPGPRTRVTGIYSYRPCDRGPFEQ